MSYEQTEDLKAFEKRLTEVISKMQPITLRWRFVLAFTSMCAVVATINWLMDSETFKVTFFQSLANHPFFTISCLFLLTLFCLGVHKRVVAPNIITSRCRQVLADYNMSCDDTGKLILKPRPNT